MQVVTMRERTKGEFSVTTLFSRFAKASAAAVGNPLAFGLASLVVIGWALTGPAFGFSDTWQLVINTGTTIITFLMVFLIQNTQNRDSAAVQLKLDEIIRATQGAHNALLDLEDLSQLDLEQFRKLYEKLASDARKGVLEGQKDTGTPEIHRSE
jgi:low affinity Fe/Cu permease